MCSIVDATSDWLVVYDNATYRGDTSESPMPLRSIWLREGSADWPTSVIVSIDIATGRQETLVRGTGRSGVRPPRDRPARARPGANGHHRATGSPSAA